MSADWSRRQVLRGAAAATAAGLISMSHTVRAAAEDAALVVTNLTDKLFVISGGGGNVTVFNSADGVLLVDGGAPTRSRDVLKLVRKLTGTAQVHTLFNTHWHWDQTGSNLELGGNGTRIVAHENTRLWLGQDIHCKWQNRVYAALPKKALPNHTFYTSATLSFGGETIEYGYLPQAHTDGDIYVRFHGANVVVAGDVVSVGAYPILDYSTNGWLGGMILATRTVADLCDDHSRVVSGTGQVQSKADVQTEHAMLSIVKERLVKLLAQGMSPREMLAAAPTREFDGAWGDPTLLVRNAYPGMVNRARELGVI